MEELKRRGEPTPPDDAAFDSNCITPGTDFMFKLGIAFRKWVEHKQATDLFWSGPHAAERVIFSGPDVPGEGEHKVMDYIRRASGQHRARGNAMIGDGSGGIAGGETRWLDDAPEADWDVNLRSLFYGLDADLIMLSLVSHMPNFALLREKMSVRHSFGKRGQPRKPKDPMRYDLADSELLEIGAPREMLELQFAPQENGGVAAATASSSSASSTTSCSCACSSATTSCRTCRASTSRAAA